MFRRLEQGSVGPLEHRFPNAQAIGIHPNQDGIVNLHPSATCPQ